MFKSKSGGKSFLKKDGMKHLGKAAMHNGIRGVATAGAGYINTKFLSGKIPLGPKFEGPFWFALGTVAEAFISDKHQELHNVAQGFATYGTLKTIEEHVATEGGAIPKNYHGLSSPSDNLNAGFDWAKIAADAARAARDEAGGGVSGSENPDLSGRENPDLQGMDESIADKLQ